MSGDGHVPMTDLRASCVAEAVATFMLCFVGAGAMVADVAFAGIGLVAVAAAHGLVLTAAVAATAHVSGAHINPAVTMAMLVTGRIGTPAAVAYMASQLAGAILGAAAVWLVFQGLPGGVEAIAAASLGTPLPAPGVPAGTVLVVEILLTLQLVFVIFGAAADTRAAALGPLAIGVAVAAGILMGGPVSGAAMNPARVFGPALVGGVWTLHWVYWVGPVAGALAGALLYDRGVLRGDAP